MSAAAVTFVHHLRDAVVNILSQWEKVGLRLQVYIKRMYFFPSFFFFLCSDNSREDYSLELRKCLCKMI